jgi:DNA-3-methyladenine glycosylase
VVDLAASLLGKVLFVKTGGVMTAGRITETEAYVGVNDRASYAWGGRRTPRKEFMYEEGGLSYVYICYGIHHLFNMVTNIKDQPDAFLIRTIEPVQGITDLITRSNKKTVNGSMTSGPGNMTKAMATFRSQNGLPLNSSCLYIADDGVRIPDSSIKATPRIGVEYAGEDSLWLNIFIILGNPGVGALHKFK